jgi:hypothetical protein
VLEHLPSELEALNLKPTTAKNKNKIKKKKQQQQKFSARYGGTCLLSQHLRWCSWSIESSRLAWTAQGDCLKK